MSRIVFGSPDWVYWAVSLAAVAAFLVAWGYTRSKAKPSVRLLCASMKVLAIVALALSLLEPLLTGSRPRRGANIFLVLSDNSQSLSIKDGKDRMSRGQKFQALLTKESPWRSRLGQDYDLRHYTFDSQLHGTDQATELTFDGPASSLESSLIALQKRFHGLPVAGILLLTDGVRTDAGILTKYQQESSGDNPLPPIYPVFFPSENLSRDIALKTVAVSQTNFESAPAIVRAEVQAKGFDGQTIVAAVVDEEGNEVDRQTATASSMDRPLNFRFQFRPKKRGVNFFHMNVFPAAEEESYLSLLDMNSEVDEQTLANNSRLFVVDQGNRPFRVLYVSGRPNWEYKFLRRAIDGDEQVDLVGLLRIAKRQPKFDFQRSGSERTSPLFEGFDNVDEETVEQRDQPVLVRLGTRDEVELRDGFPKSAAELFQYHAVILDDLEAEFFSQDQLTLLRNFVSVRGGGLLMLGGASSFSDGGYDRTPVGELLPIYLNLKNDDAKSVRNDSKFRFLLTREGWLQPWTRTKQTEEEEKKRLANMPSFAIANPVNSLKPGAYVLAEVKDEGNRVTPALVAHQFGQGHVAALLIGDFWRWALSRRNSAETDFDRSWRQLVRWLISDVPDRVELSLKTSEADLQILQLETRVRDQEFRLLDNAGVEIRVTSPNGEDFSLEAEPDDREPGLYTTAYSLRAPGAYRFEATAMSPEGTAIGKDEKGWAAQPGVEEYSSLTPDLNYLEGLASQTGGNVVDANDMDSFVESLSNKKVPIQEPWTSPLWHQPLYFLFTIGCLIVEWGLRRVNGLA